MRVKHINTHGTFRTESGGDGILSITALTQFQGFQMYFHVSAVRTHLTADGRPRLLFLSGA